MTPEVVAQLPAIVAALIVAVVMSFALTPLAIRFARRVGAIDHRGPGSRR